MARRREDFGQKRAAELAPLALPIYSIETGGRLRPLDTKALEELKKSLAEIGLQSPITVRRDEEGAYHLIVGFHRLKAAEALGWYAVDSIMVEWDETRARKWEIAENLHRADLTVQQRSSHQAEWIRLTEQEQGGVSVQLEPKPQGGRPEGGISAASRELGINKTEAIRSIMIDSISPEAQKAAAEAGLGNNQTALLSVARAKTPEDQVAKVREIADKRPKTFGLAMRPRLSDEERSEKRIGAFVQAWGKLLKEERALALEKIGAVLYRPVMDRRFGSGS